jgi:hypothetical protein
LFDPTSTILIKLYFFSQKLDEAIKWPELNAHNDNYALPAKPTGGSGFGDEADEYDRAPSRSGGGSSTVGGGGLGYANSTATNSTPHLFDSNADPYGVPPIPSNDPTNPVPYRDDPAGNAPAAYYDPYAAASAGYNGQKAFSQEGGYAQSAYSNEQYAAAAPQQQGYAGQGEAIPMTQIRTRSPGPQAGYQLSDSQYANALPDPRGPSPAPPQAQAQMHPQAMMAGRQSPGPGQMMGRQSPGPQQMMQAGRQSPGPYQGYEQGGQGYR